MKLWRKIDLRDFGASRQIRFGHLTGTEEWQIVIPQAQTSGCRGIDAQNQLADFGIGFALGLSLAVLRMECANEDAFVVPVYLHNSFAHWGSSFGSFYRNSITRQHK